MIPSQIKTILLLGLLTGVLLGIGYLLGGEQGIVIALVFAAVINFVSFWFSDKIVLKMYRAKRAEPDKDKEIIQLVEDVCKIAKVPNPAVYIIPSQHANAFATGRSKRHAAVAVTEGIVKLLTKDELKGVIAHEISHVKNKDILVSSIAATIAGAISYIAYMARWTAIFGGMGRDRDSGNIVELLFIAVLTPLIALVIQMAISRSREFLADATGAKILHNPYGLASALEKLHNDVKRNPLRFGNKAASHLFIVNPFSGRSLMNLFSTHPPFEERVKRLRSMTSF